MALLRGIHKMPSTHKWLAQRQNRPGISHRGGERAQSDRQEAWRTQAEPRWWGPHEAIPKREVLPKVGARSSRGKRLSRRGTATRGRAGPGIAESNRAGRRKAAGGKAGAGPTCFPPRVLLVNCRGRYLPGSCLSVCIAHKSRSPAKAVTVFPFPRSPDCTWVPSPHPGRGLEAWGCSGCGELWGPCMRCQIFTAVEPNRWRSLYPWELWGRQSTIWARRLGLKLLNLRTRLCS